MKSIIWGAVVTGICLFLLSKSGLHGAGYNVAFVYAVVAGLIVFAGVEVEEVRKKAIR